MTIIIVARVDSLAKNVPLFSHEETSERLEGGDLERKDTPSDDKETDGAKVEKFEEIVKCSDCESDTKRREEKNEREYGVKIGGNEVRIEVPPKMNN